MYISFIWFYIISDYLISIDNVNIEYISTHIKCPVSENWIMWYDNGSETIFVVSGYLYIKEKRGFRNTCIHLKFQKVFAFIAFYC